MKGLIRVTPKLFKLADNPKDMSTKSPNQIYKIIKPCGLGPQKSKAIHKLSNILCTLQMEKFLTISKH